MRLQVKIVAASALLVICLLIGVSMAANAQSSDVTVNGVVTDQTGADIPGATVTVTNIDTGLVHSATSDTAGRYTILSVPAGTYDVQAKQEGFAASVISNKTFFVGTTVTQDFHLSLSSVSQTVVVNGQNDVSFVQPTDSTVERVLQPKELDNLPSLTRSFQDLAALTPGVQVSGTSITVGASQANETGYVVDDLSAEDNHAGGEYVNFAQDWIQEFAVQTESFPAEYGTASGGVVNAITRSGGNQVRGRTYGYFQDAALNAVSPFLKAAGQTSPPFNQQRLGGMVGGPIRKDKIFYFAGYEYFRNVSSTPVSIPAAFTVIPDAQNGVFPQGSGTQLGMFKLDYQLDSNNSINFRANYEHDSSYNSSVGGVTTLGPGTRVNGSTFLYNIQWRRILSPTSLNELRASLALDRSTNVSCNYFNSVGPYPGGGAQATPFGNPVGWVPQVTYAQAGGVVTGCPAVWGGPIPEEPLYIYEVFSKTAGSHDIKVGASIARRDDSHHGYRNNSDGQYGINGTIPFNPTTPSTFPISLFQVWEPDSENNFHYVGRSVSGFIQDKWRITKSLTLNPGLRYDVDFTNSMLSGQGFVLPHPLNNDYHDISPRFGVAWSPFKDKNRTVIRGGAGLYYDQNHSALINDFVTTTVKPTVDYNLNATRPSLNPYCLANPSPCGTTVPATYAQDVEEVLAYALANATLPNFSPTGGQIILGGKTYSITPLPKYTAANNTQLPVATGGAFDIPQNALVPGTLQTSIGIQEQVTQGFSFSSDFLYAYGYNQIESKNVNLNPITLQVVNPNYTTVISTGNDGFFKGYDLLASALYRSRRGDLVTVAYTLGWQFNNSAGNFALSTRVVPATNPFDLNLDYGPSANDARNTLKVSGVFLLPWGIQLAPIFSFQSALPYTATTTLTPPGCLSYFTSCYPTGFTRDSLRGDSTIALNGRVSKTFKLGESRSVGVLFEAYNALNRANYGINYGKNVSASNFEQPIGLGSGLAMRQLQVGFIFNF